MSKSCVIIYLGLAGRFIDNAEPPEVGSYLQDYDLEYAGGRGHANWTTDLSKALVFNSGADAVAAYMGVPKSRPTRDDGRPNRPLTTYTVVIEPFG